MRLPAGLLAYLLPALLLGALSGCSGKDSTPDLRVDNLEYKLLPRGARIVSGTVRNDGELPVSAAQVQISLFDEKNRRVDAMYALIRDVPAGGSVDFRESVQSEFDINGARVRSILLLD